MNLSTIALLLIAWQVLSNNGNNSTQQNTPKSSPLEGLSGFLSDDTKNIISCVNKLNDSQCSQEDKTGAIFQMMTNPAVMNIASSFFGAGSASPQQNGASDKAADATCDAANGEGYKFEQPSAHAQEFFRPIDNIADAEVKHKLYWFYDNWYIK